MATRSIFAALINLPVKEAAIVRYPRGVGTRPAEVCGERQLARLDVPDAVFVDGGGVGGGVVDRLKMLGYRVIEVQSGEKARDEERYLNRRVEMWDAMREWLVYGCIDRDEALIDDLTNPEYSIHLKGQLKLESKDAMRKRGLASTDDGDALALTFAEPVARIDANTARRMNRMRGMVADNEYAIFDS